MTTGFGNDFLDLTPTKIEINWNHIQKKFLCIKEHNQQSKKATYGMEEIV